MKYNKIQILATMSRKKIHKNLTRQKPWRPQFALEKMFIRREADELTVLSSHQKNAYTTVETKNMKYQ